jgi:DNA polymerase-1
MKKLFLLDAYSLIFRAHYAFIRRPITTSKGFDTSAIFGFTKSLQEVLKKEQPSHLAVVFDPPGGSFRRRLYEAYKANREQTPEQIIAAVPVIKKIIEAYRIPIMEMPDYEADDLIGAVAKHAEKQGFTVYMMTPDKDYGQLVSDNIFMYKPKRSGNDVEIIGVPEICELYGIQRPEQVIDILALWGDSSDNVPGAPGIGEKTASQLVAKYGNLDKIYEHLDELKGKQRESLLDNEAQVRLARQLVTIVTDLPFDWNEDELAVKPADEERLMELFSECEFSSMLRELQRTEIETKSFFHINTDTEKLTPTVKSKESYGQMSLFGENAAEEKPAEVHRLHKCIEDLEHRYMIAQTDEEIDALVSLLESSKEFCFDTETTGLDPFNCRMVGMSFAVNPHEAWYVPVSPNNLDAASARVSRFKKTFENAEIAKTGQNIKFDIEVLSGFGVEVKGQLYDSMLLHYLLNPDMRHNMNFLAENYLDYSPIEIESLIGKKGAGQRTMDVAPLEKIAEYAAEDADITLQLRHKFYPMLENEGMTELYSEIEAPLIGVLAAMEASGVRIAEQSLNELNSRYTQELAAIEADIRTMTGESSLNIASPKQLGVVLFEKLNIAGSNVKKTKTKQYSTDEETLVGLRDKHPVVDKILEYRTVKKLLSAYIESLPTLVNRRTGKIHTSFNQAVTATGRLSSNNPNLQNIPIRDARGREIRRAFVASDDNHLLLSADYSQIELRIMAHLSGDANLIEAFNNDMDIHTATAAKIFKVEPDMVSKEQRGRAKTANFGIIYGISSFGLAQRLGISRSEAKQLIDGYFATYPGVQEYMNRIVYEAQNKGYVQTIFGRRRWLRDINSNNSMMRGMAERNAINAPIQGTAADIIKIAMIHIHNILKTKSLRSRMILQVHDELIFDVYKPELDEIIEIVVREMQNAAQISVPLIVEYGAGENWLDAH